MWSSWLAVVGLAFTAVSVQLARRQLRDGYEHRFVERFWVLEDKRLDSKYSGGTVAPVEHERYLRLCEDEYEAMGLGGVSFRTWNVWHAAVRECLKLDGERRGHLDQLRETEYELVRSCVVLEAHRPGACPALATRQRLLGATLDAFTRRSVH